MPIRFDRTTCRDLNETISREWLVTNGLGGYAAGTVAGVLTRMQHGLLVAVPPDAITPQLLLAKIDEEVVFDERTYYLGTNEYRDGTLNPAGFVHLETFRLDEGFPVFTYHLGGLNGIMLEKRIWMPYGRNTTYIQYRVLRTAPTDEAAYKRSNTGHLSAYGRFRGYAEAAPRSLTLTLLPFSAHRPHHTSTQASNERHFQVQLYRSDQPIDKDKLRMMGIMETIATLPEGVTGCTLHTSDDDVVPCHILAVSHAESRVTFLPTGVWYWNFLRRHDAAAGLPATDDLYLPGVFRATLWPDEDAALTIIVSTEPLSTQVFRQDHLRRIYTNNVERQQQLFSRALEPQRYFGDGGDQAPRLRVLPLTITSDPYAGGEEYLRQLLQAADRFLIRREFPRSGYSGDHGTLFGKAESVPLLLSHYYTMEVQTRDTLISLPGLMLVTGRYDEALHVLRELTRYFRGGLLPNFLPLTDSPPQEHDYANVDSTLWFFSALDHYLRMTHNYAFLEEFYYHLTDCIERYIQGTTHGLHVDPEDGLLGFQQSHKALTWMNASVNGIPLTPRSGKTVEINALWYNALCLIHEWSRYLHLARQERRYEILLTRCQHSFQERFWYATGDYLYDVIDGPGGNDAAMRPNQLFALSLRHPALDVIYRQRVIDAVTQHLLTPYGLRTLAPYEPGYRGRMGDNRQEQQRSLHQGACWMWLLGPYIEAMLVVNHQPMQGMNHQDEQVYQEYIWRKGLQLLEPFKGLLHEGILGMSAGIFDGDAPHRAQWPGNDVTSALSTGTLLHIYDLLAHMRIEQSERVFAR